MMNFINAIPDSIGWTMVGVLGTLAVLLGGLLIRTVTQMVRERIEERKEL
jgi:hypothetical protein